MIYTVECMEERYELELEPEVRLWLEGLPPAHYRIVKRHADRLADAPTTLGEPYARHLHGSLRELRFHLGDTEARITYWLAPQRRIVLLTVFAKTRMREEAQVTRALWAQKTCESEHGAAATTYHRSLPEES